MVITAKRYFGKVCFVSYALPDEASILLNSDKRPKVETKLAVAGRMAEIENGDAVLTISTDGKKINLYEVVKIEPIIEHEFFLVTRKVAAGANVVKKYPHLSKVINALLKEMIDARVYLSGL